MLIVTYTQWVLVSMCFYGCENSGDFEDFHYSSDQNLYKSLSTYMLLSILLCVYQSYLLKEIEGTVLDCVPYIAFN